MEKFYTPAIVAKLMVDLIPISFNPSSAVDICCGSWNLLKASKQRWPAIKLTGIDINKELQKHASNKCCFHCMDGRKFALEAYKNNQRYPIIVANPPFGKELIETAGQFNQLPGYSEITTLALQRIETTMILANLALLSENGVLCIVVPSTIVDGDWAACLRSYIESNFYIKKIVQLPSTVFGRDISTAILIIENRKSKSRFIRVYEATEKKNGSYKLTFLYKTFQSEAEYGRWKYNTSPSPTESYFQIKRGQIGNNLLGSSGLLPVIHSTDVEQMNKPDWRPTRYLPENAERSGFIPYSQCGDIVIIRVGRNAGHAALHTASKRMLISDCIYIIKSDDQKVLNNIWGILNSRDYLDNLDSMRKGVTTKYITIDTLKNYLNYKLEQKGGDMSDHHSTRSEGTG